MQLILECRGAPIPELREIEAAVEDGRRVQPPAAFADADRNAAPVVAAVRHVVAADARDGAIRREALVAEQLFAELHAFRIESARMSERAERRTDLRRDCLLNAERPPSPASRAIAARGEQRDSEKDPSGLHPKSR